MSQSDPLRQALHKFAISYHVESAEGRKADLDYMVGVIAAEHSRRMVAELEGLRERMPKKMSEDTLPRSKGRIRARNTAIDKALAVLDTELSRLKRGVQTVPVLDNEITGINKRQG